MERRHDIDWLRILAILGVLYFHVAMIFTEEWDWHIKNEQKSYLWLEFNFWLSRFRMPLLFFISGFGTYLALRKRNSWQYIKERHNRLLVPLVFSMFVIVPPQIYFERIFDDPGSYSSILDFYPNTFNLQPYPEGDFSWHHMWFVLYLFFYSVVGLPLFLYFRSERGKEVLNNLLGKASKFGIVILILPTLLISLFWTMRFDRTNDFINDWGSHPYWFTFFLVGYVIGCVPSLWEHIEKERRTFLGMAILCIVLINVFRWNRMEPWNIDTVHPILQYMSLSLFPLDAWMWILASIGYGKKYLNKSHPILDYANQAIYPFYILHQTVIIVIGFYVIQIEESVLAKYLLISTLSLLGSIAIYEFLIRPFGLTRFLFGVKIVKSGSREAKTVPVEPEEAEKTYGDVA